jgi:hypothetical protein
MLTFAMLLLVGLFILCAALACFVEGVIRSYLAVHGAECAYFRTSNTASASRRLLILRRDSSGAVLNTG